VLGQLDFFYHKEHLFIVCELLKDNLYEFYKVRTSFIFTLPHGLACSLAAYV